MLSSLIPWITLIKAFFELNFMIDLRRNSQAFSTQVSWISPLNVPLIFLAHALNVQSASAMDPMVLLVNSHYFSFLKSIWLWIITYIKRRKIRNIKCSTNIILTWKFQFIYFVFNSFKDFEWIIPSGLQLRSSMG